MTPARMAEYTVENEPLEREIDRQVYALHGPTPKKIKIVEEASQ